MILSGHKLVPRRDDSFCNQSDDLIYQEIKSCLHFNENSTLNPNIHTKDFQIEPFCTFLNEEFKKFGLFDENLSVDEQIVKY